MTHVGYRVVGYGAALYYIERCFACFYNYFIVIDRLAADSDNSLIQAT